MELLKLSWRSIWRNKVRTLISASAIAFGLALTVFSIALGDGVYDQMIDDAVRGNGGHFTLEHPEYRDAPAIDLALGDATRLRGILEETPGVKSTKVLILGQGVVRSGAGAVGVAVMGVEPEAERGTSPMAEKITEGEYLADDDRNKIVIGGELAERLDLAIGKKLVITTNDAKGDLVEELFRVRGIFTIGSPEVDGYVAQIPISHARKLYSLGDDQVTQLGAVLEDAGERGRVMAAFTERMGDTDASVLTWEQVLPTLANYVEIDGNSNKVFNGIIIFLSLFTVFNTIVMSVLERTKEFAVLLALGTPPRFLRAQIWMESALLGFLGVAIGLLIGGSGAYALMINGLDLSELYQDGANVSGFAIDTMVYPKLTAALLIQLGGLVWLATIAVSLFATRRINEIAVADVLR